MFHLLNLFSTFSIVIPSTITVVRFRKIPAPFHPFVYLLWIGVTFEIGGYLMAIYIRNNIVIGNIYVLLESLILLWQLSSWMNFKSATRKYVIIGLCFLVLWLVDNIVVHDITRINSLFRVIYSFCIVFLSIEQINIVFLSERNTVLKNPVFLLCGTFIIYFTFKTLFEVFYMINVRMSNTFYHALYLMAMIINLLTNIIYAIAILWIPKKLKFSLPL